MPAEALIDEVWGDEPPEAARGTLHSYISHLRKALGPERIEGRRPDTSCMSRRTSSMPRASSDSSGRPGSPNGSPGRAGALLREALALWTGPAFADLASEPSLAGEIARLDELRLQALEERIARRPR